MEKTTLAKAEHKPPNPISTEVKLPSGSADLQFYVSFGLLVSCKLGDVDRIRGLIEGAGGRIVFQTVSNGLLFLLRQAQVDRILHGDTSAIAEVHRKKTRRSEKI